MTRFRKGTTDHDGDGNKGGSLKSGSRFVSGTNDPDNDGRKGGSLPKGDDMAKKTTRRHAPDKAAAPVDNIPARKAAVKEQIEEADAKADPADEAMLGRQIRAIEMAGLLDDLIEAAERAESLGVEMEVKPRGVRLRGFGWNDLDEYGQYRREVPWLEIVARINVLIPTMEQMQTKLHADGFVHSLPQRQREKAA